MNQDGAFFLAIMVAVGGAWAAFHGAFKRKRLTVFEYQWVLLYKNGQFNKILPAGVHKLREKTYSWIVFDRRISQLMVIGQDVLTKDGLGIKLSTYIEYVIEDPRKLSLEANVTSAGVMSYLYAIAQMPIREAVTEHSLEELVAQRDVVSGKIKDNLLPRFSALGVVVRHLGIRDVMLGKEIKDAFAGELLAKKQSAVLLEATRAETAALRSLANAARMLRDNPEILKLRVLQAMQNNSGKNTIVVDFSAQNTAVSSNEIVAS
jgi:regulator of protease activity HflC (stomatin/prohibitin superfamily)